MNARRMKVVSVLTTLAATVAARGQTITVTTGLDVIDVGYQATIADLPGADGKVSFTEAMVAANNTPGHQTIAFAIPQNEWDFQWLYPGRAVVHTSGGVGVRASDETTIDGTTQTAFTGDTNPDGAEIAMFPGEIYLNADNSSFIGIDSTTVNINGSNSLARYNSGAGNINLFSGTGSLIENNTTGTIKIDRSDDNVVIGNTCQRVRIWGFVGPFGTGPASNNRIGGPNPEDRNYITGYGTWDGEGFPGGTTVQIFDTFNTVVENNWIGTTPDGLAQGNLASTVGVGFEGENHDAIIRNNRIAGILGHGIGPHADGLLFGSAIQVYGTGSGIAITGNTIGLNANDEPVLGSVTGISAVDYYLGPVQDVTIGGTGPGEGNKIAGHLLWGISVVNPFDSVRITGNSIHDNDDLGVDLVPPTFERGVTPNDNLDADAGGNGLQNFPVLTSATRQGGSVQFVGMLNSTPMDDFTVEFFASADCHTSGFGEGELFLGTTSVTTDAGGDAAFDVLLPAAIPDGWVVTATATLEPIGATSEFSACVAATGTGAAAGIAAASCCADHGPAGELCLDMASGDVESRQSGLTKLVFDLTAPAANVSASVSCTNEAYTGTVTTTADGSSVASVEFLPALPDGDCCTVTLSGDAVGSFVVVPLAGDTNGNGAVTTSDASIIKPHFGETADASNARFDFNGDGAITTADFSQIKPRFNTAATTCP